MNIIDHFESRFCSSPVDWVILVYRVTLDQVFSGREVRVILIRSILMGLVSGVGPGFVELVYATFS
mgnify:CR=1 FL=1